MSESVAPGSEADYVSPEAVFRYYEPVAADYAEAVADLEDIHTQLADRKVTPIKLEHDPWFKMQLDREKGSYTHLLRLRIGANGIDNDPRLQQVIDQATEQIDRIENEQLMLGNQPIDEITSGYVQLAASTERSPLDLMYEEMNALIDEKKQLSAAVKHADALLQLFAVLPTPSLISPARQVGLVRFVIREREAGAVSLANTPALAPHALSSKQYAALALTIKAPYEQLSPKITVTELIAYLLLDSGETWTIDALASAIYGESTSQTRNHVGAHLGQSMNGPTQVTNTLNFFDRKLVQAIVPNPGDISNQKDTIVAYRALPLAADN